MLAVTAETVRSPLAHVSDGLARVASLTAGTVTAAEPRGRSCISHAPAYCANTYSRHSASK